MNNWFFDKIEQYPFFLIFGIWLIVGFVLMFVVDYNEENKFEKNFSSFSPLVINLVLYFGLIKRDYDLGFSIRAYIVPLFVVPGIIAFFKKIPTRLKIVSCIASLIVYLFVVQTL